MRRIWMVLLAVGALFAFPAAAHADYFTGPNPSPVREGFYDVTHYTNEEARVYQARWFGQHEDGSNMWHVINSQGEEYAVSCKIMPADPETGESSIDCGVTAMAYGAADPATYPEPVKVKVAQLDWAMQNGMTGHMPYAAATTEPTPAPVSSSSPYEQQQQQDQIYC